MSMVKTTLNTKYTEDCKELGHLYLLKAKVTKQLVEVEDKIAQIESTLLALEGSSSQLDAIERSIELQRATQKASTLQQTEANKASS